MTESIQKKITPEIPTPASNSIFEVLIQHVKDATAEIGLVAEESAVVRWMKGQEKSEVGLFGLFKKGAESFVQNLKDDMHIPDTAPTLVDGLKPKSGDEQFNTKGWETTQVDLKIPEFVQSIFDQVIEVTPDMILEVIEGGKTVFPESAETSKTDRTIGDIMDIMRKPLPKPAPIPKGAWVDKVVKEHAKTEAHAKERTKARK